MPKQKNFIVDNEFYCVDCGSKGIPVVRRKGAERGAGHLKKLYCLKCGREVNHVECIPWTKYTHEDFLIERELNNFDEEGNRKLPYSQLKGDIKYE